MNTKTVTTLFLAAMAVSGIQATWAVSGGPDTFGYTYMDSKELEGPIYAFEDISGSGTPVVLADDEVSGAVALGFDFEFYGIEYSEIYISSNGFLTVLDGQDFAFEGTFLPDTGDPNGVIAGWWTDLNPAEGGSIHVQTLGAAPDRRFIVQFTDVPHFGETDTTTHQYKLFEGSNVIEVHYAKAEDIKNPYAGIENETGSDGLTYSEDRFLDDMTAVQYLPPMTNLVCATATPSIDRIWPPNHKFVPIEITGIEDPSGAHVLITIDSIYQDEPVNTIGDGNTQPDASGIGSSVAQVRAERTGAPRVPGDGRVYHIAFTATGGQSECSGEVLVGVPHDKGAGSVIVDGGPLYDSTE